MTDPHVPGGIRLQKVLANAGLGSRRACEKLITQGRVKVDGAIVRELGTRVDPDAATIHVDNQRILFDENHITLALNKPIGVVSSMADEFDRPDLSQFVEHRPERLFHVGRLDTDTDGLILLTNDGELAHRLAHPSFEVPKTYVAVVTGVVRRGLPAQLTNGVTLEDGPVRLEQFRIIEQGPESAIVELTLHEGRKHIVRRLLEHVDHPVQSLTRVRFGSIRLGDLKPGRTRVISGDELGHLMKTVDL